MSGPTATNNDLHRDIGRMEGRLDAMEDRLSKIEAIAERIDSRLAKQEAESNKAKGRDKVLIGLASGAGALAVLATEMALRLWL